MGVIRRMRDITVATLNEMLENAEDPLELIDRYLREKREQLRELEQLVRQMSQHTRVIRDRFLHAEKWKEKREEQALLAIKAGEEEVARMVLEEKLQYEEESRKYRDLYHESKSSLEEAELLLESVRREVQEVAAKRQIYMARLETLRLKQRMNQHMRGVGGAKNPERSFERLEEKLMDLETEADALWELRGREGRMTRFERSVERFGSKVEQELENLKRRLNEEGGRKG